MVDNTQGHLVAALFACIWIGIYQRLKRQYGSCVAACSDQLPMAMEMQMMGLIVRILAPNRKRQGQEQSIQLSH